MQQTSLDSINIEVANCGKPIHYWDKKSGRMKKTHRKCKRYNLCPKCAAWKKMQTQEQLSDYVGKARFIIVPKSEEKQTARRIQDNYRRVAVSDTHTAFVVDTKDESFGCVFQKEDLSLVVDHCIPQDGRRMSGKLGIKPVVALEEEMSWEELEKEFTDPTIECHYREFRIDFDTGDEDRPETDIELEKIVQQEVDLPHSPTTEGELQEAMYVVEMKTREVCERHGMSFNFLDKKVKYIRMSEVDWKWLPKKE